MTITEILNICVKRGIVNSTITDNLIRAYSIINSPKYKNILCTISGGSDSDIVLDICSMVDNSKKIDYVWFNTGLEYQATKDHLVYLENKYNVHIRKEMPKKPIPIACKEYGQPFLNKYVSYMIDVAQRHGFKFEDKPYDELMDEYPDIYGVVNWWSGKYYGTYSISRNKYLKEFLVSNPPNFKISAKCCDYAKKSILHHELNSGKYDLNISGVRKSEGGIRAARYKSCFDDVPSDYDNYRPIFWYKDADKHDYEKAFEIIHSKCYTEYGLVRTGCVGCPFSRNCLDEMNIVKKHEPKLYIAINNIFKESYEYTAAYKKFIKNMKGA